MVVGKAGRTSVITGPPNGPVLLCSLASVGVCLSSVSSSVVVCNAAGGRAPGLSGGRHFTAGQYSYFPLGRHVVVPSVVQFSLIGAEEFD